MKFRTIFGGLLALPLLYGATALGHEGPMPLPPEPRLAMDFQVPLPATGLPGVRYGQDAGTIVLAQAGDPRVTALEEQVRQLHGQIEEMNFLILQMQDQIRRMQEDNEFRFQEIEERRSDSGAATPRGSFWTKSSPGNGGPAFGPENGALRSAPPADTNRPVVSGVFFSEHLFGKPLTFTHKTVFGILSWLIFGGLLAGHYLRGWRGRTAVLWTLAGFMSLLLAYVGSKVVLELILKRG